MPIIINEFEIIANPPPAPEAQRQSPQVPAQVQPTLRPEDIERVQRYHCQRRERIRAD
jgi:hypothetical protein